MIPQETLANVHPLAGKPAPAQMLIDPNRIERDYFENRPDKNTPHQLVNFGTSGHRGTPADGTFNEPHILAITQAICDYRRKTGIQGPLYLGKDTHAASIHAERTVIEVLAGNQVNVHLQLNGGFTPTPAISRAILSWNRTGHSAIADGIVVTPSHNPPQDGGIKYNPPSGGPADTSVTSWIQDRANELLRSDNTAVKRTAFEKALKQATTVQTDFIQPYIQALASVLDMEAIRSSGIRIGVAPLGGASAQYWEPLREHYKLDLAIINPKIDPTFSFMPVDHDGKIRMDCSSKWAMQGLVQHQKDYDVAFGNDPDADRHGIVTPSHGLMDPNQYLATAIHFLHTRRPGWPLNAAVGKTVVSSSMIDRIVQSVGRRLAEVPVGFKWFADGLHNGTYCFGGEESAGASFLQTNGTVWTTDKDGILLGLLAAEITARTGQDPAVYFHHLAALLGHTYYRRKDSRTTAEQKQLFKNLVPASIKSKEFAGYPIVAIIDRDPENNSSIGGLKVVTSQGWFAARPSGTEDIIKIYAESFIGKDHLDTILHESCRLIDDLTGSANSAGAKPN